MALHYIIGGLQLLSVAVNVLALGAFWVSPGLRTTANRFVINLLVVNVVACLALTPALWLNGGFNNHLHRPATNHDDYVNEHRSMAMVQRMEDHHYRHIRSTQEMIEIENEFQTVHTTNEWESETEQSLQYDVHEAVHEITMRSDCSRFWGFDLAATLGKRSCSLKVSILRIHASFRLALCCTICTQYHSHYLHRTSDSPSHIVFRCSLIPLDGSGDSLFIFFCLRWTLHSGARQ